MRSSSFPSRRDAGASRPLRVAAAAVLCAAVLLPACSVLPEAEPLDVYVLPVTGDASATAVPAAAGAQAWSLRVVRPAAGVHLAGQRIVVMPEDNRVSVYQGAGWSDPAPVLVRDRVLEAFRADGRVGALSSDERQLHADFELDSDLRAFQSEYRGGRPEAVLRLDARLVHTASRRIVASRTFEQRQPTEDPAVPAVVQAFGTAADRLSAAVVDWTVREAAAVR
ncbi:MAG TPA: ABC-type transport auxiliary lipoprotein family protein [Thauera sp.]|uniref:ABC-type transport auxiliary lipoprotein family protein n=1 Tax=Thauera sp. TaxID=1905334 RepID=UPI000FBC4F21|nr:ABC-type transport auxiliary lipoprotein family protein [Thauera sp.]RTL25402.1 MAG: ABC transporter [Rhodocyclaceae bacterium]MCB1944749.1 membrane integrity-associated transporter subunit PqiC [Thauera sp.]MCP5224584.1 membrane integrity-associated transporter subunit PqiC [Thauera sp.]HPE04388.1 ABC-type transport auxiliary lipoprotein family protein [Thauera sp.]HRV79573.1 ABC-type transport auxiliary lipoprotein family protein [Thauera sp.]